jgi:acyl-CoA reductase-like NAD-dependent aldehyde dehydrogenase
MMTAWKLAPALAAGCSIVLKPDPQTPLTAYRLAELATEVGFPAGVINVVPGDGPTTGAYLVGIPASTRSRSRLDEDGRRDHAPLLRADQAPDASSSGGKSPNIVFATPTSTTRSRAPSGRSTTRPARAARRARGCSSRQSIYDDVVAAFDDKAEALKVGDPLDAGDAGRLAHPHAHRDRVHGYVESGTGRGRRGRAGGEPATARAPSISRPCSRASRLDDGRAGEIFGPVVTAIPFEDEKDAIRIANDVRYGSFATVWTGDPARGPRVARADEVGACRDQQCRSRPFPGIPFGGYKQSGFGRSSRSTRSSLYLETKGVLFSTSPKPFNPFGL